jgi:hypothetical protein
MRSIVPGAAFTSPRISEAPVRRQKGHSMSRIGLFAKFLGAALALCGSLATSPARAQAPIGCYPIPAPAVPNYSQPPNLDFVKQQLPLQPL